ncbi:hypothetical protein H5410_058133 [Solanum commersonii]|uniref:Sulfotransferase n=1 Tax=Solanum commersonii TaxID=4109 RepID=A0A9J5WRX7_SOLCO|nr:hypothetical protein H5410_058133 [Solanum commersonii]
MSMNMKYEGIISSLPRREVSQNFSSFDYYQYKGFWFPLAFLESILFMEENFKAQPSTIFLCGDLKTGTTWLKSLIFSIMTRHHFDDSTNPILTKLPHDRIPTFEIDCDINLNSLDDTKFPLLGTHLPYTCLGETISHQFKDNPITLEQEIKRFLEGKSLYGPYWDHVSEYRKASKDHHEMNEIFFLKYEDLKNDTLSYVKKLAKFMGNHFLKRKRINLYLKK